MAWRHPWQGLLSLEVPERSGLWSKLGLQAQGVETCPGPLHLQAYGPWPLLLGHSAFQCSKKSLTGPWGSCLRFYLIVWL